jgi:septal ring factor EnvC (AmiA/AmiB activator)
MNMSDLPRLITDCETSASRVKGVLDDFVVWLSNVRNDIAKSEAELVEKRRLADQQTALLQSQIAKLKAEHANAELELRQIRKQIERERSDLGMEKKRLLQSLDEALAR